MKNIILDVNVILDLWFCRVSEEAVNAIASLIADAPRKQYQSWIAASSLHVLEYVSIRQLKKENVPPAEAKGLAKALIKELLCHVKPLTIFGGDQTEAVRIGGDLEDTQIVFAAKQLQTPTAIVTNDKRFPVGESVVQLFPGEAEQWLSGDLTDKVEFIDLKTQQDSIRPGLERNIHGVLHHGQFIMGPEVKELETKLEAYTGARHCITVASGTEALLISLMALGIGPGDEVITTPFTFVATAEVIVLLGATPVFVDVEPDTCNIDADKIEAAITPKTKAIIPVSLYGQVADMDEINAIAARHGTIAVIEDAAQSFGATYKGRKTCNLSTIGCTSFFPSKPLGCYGDGGAIFTNDDDLAKAMREIRVHGQERRYYHARIGVGGRMDTLQCAVVLAKLERFDWEIEQRTQVGDRYLKMLKGIPAVTRLVIRPDRDCVWGQFTIQVENRGVVLEKLKDAGIPTAVHYPVPLHRQPAYRSVCRISDDLENADTIASKVFSLPMHPYLDENTQVKIINALAAAIS